MKQAANAAQSLLFSVLLINKERRIKLACLPKLQRISKKMTKASSRKSEDGRSKDEISIRCNSKVFFLRQFTSFLSVDSKQSRNKAGAGVRRALRYLTERNQPNV